MLTVSSASFLPATRPYLESEASQCRVVRNNESPSLEHCSRTRQFSYLTKQPGPCTVSVHCCQSVSFIHVQCSCLTGLLLWNYSRLSQITFGVSWSRFSPFDFFVAQPTCQCTACNSDITRVIPVISLIFLFHREPLLKNCMLI